MDKHLEELFLEFPRRNTLGWLIYEGAMQFEQRGWLAGKAAVTFKMADILSFEIAAFLKENGHHRKSYLYIDIDSSEASSIVLLGAVKAGVTLVDEKIHPPLVKQKFIDNKRLLAFENNKFIDGNIVTDYRQAIKQGENALFFNTPDIDETCNAFHFFKKDKNTALQTWPMDHQKAVKQIYSSATGQNLHPYIRIIYHWFNGFAAPVNYPCAETAVPGK